MVTTGGGDWGTAGGGVANRGGGDGAVRAANPGELDLEGIFDFQCWKF